MSNEERTGQRDLLYNDWHRRNSFARFMTLVEADRCAAIDVDFCEYCKKCYQPLALVETQRSRSFDKPYTVTRNLALLAGLKAFVVSYWATEDGLDIEGMKVQQVAPDLHAPVTLAAPKWALHLYELRREHEANECKSPHAIKEVA